MRSRFSLPLSFILVPALTTALGAVISGGVAVSQAAGGAGWGAVDLRFFYFCLAGGALVLLVWRFAPVRWLDDEVYQRIDADDYIAEHRSGRPSLSSTFGVYASIGLIVCLLVARALWFVAGRRLVNDGLDPNAPLPNGSSGAALFGMTLGSVHLFGYDWTGVELVLISSLLALLGYTLWKGFGRLLRTNR